MFARALTLLALASVAIAAEAQTSCPKIADFDVTSSCRLEATGAPPCAPGQTAEIRLVELGPDRKPYTLPSCQTVTWDFGDGQTATTSSPVITHFYEQPGHYRGKATINNGSQTGTRQFYVTVAKGWIRINWQLTPPFFTYPAEGKDSVVQFYFERSTADEEVSFSLETDPADRNSGVTYAPTKMTVTFAPGEASKLVSVPLIDDAVFRGLTSVPIHYAPLTPGWVLRSPFDDGIDAHSVADNDTPVASFTSTTFHGSEKTGIIPVTIDIAGESVVPLALKYEVDVDSGPQWTTTHGEQTIPAGAKTYTFEVKTGVADDALYNSARSASIQLQTTASLKPLSGWVDLLLDDDEPVPVLSLEDLQVTEGTGTTFYTHANVKARLSQAADHDLRFDVRLEYESATQADVISQWATTPRTFAVLWKTTETVVDIGVTADNFPEGDETLTVVAESPSGVPQIGRGRAKLTIVNDDFGASFTPASSEILIGEPMTIKVTLPQPVTSTTTLPLENSAPSRLRAPASVTFGAGTAVASIEVLALSPGDARLTLRQDGNTATGNFTVVTYDVTFYDGPKVRLMAGQTAHILPILTPRPSPLMFFFFDVQSSNPAVVSAPARIYTTSLAFDIQAHVPGNATITLRTPGGGIVKSFDVEVVEQGDSLLTISPSAGSTRGGTLVTIGGRNFYPGCTATFGNTAATVVSAAPGKMIVKTPAHAAGIVDVRVQCDANVANASNAFVFIEGKSRSVRH